MVTWLWSILTYLLLVGGFLLGLVLIAHILLQKRSPAGTIAWLLVIGFLPWVGVPLYLFFGGRKMARQAERKARLELATETAIADEDAHMIDRILRSYHNPGAETGHHVKLCVTGLERYETMVGLLESAQRSIYLSTFIYHNDETGRRILEILTEKARTGVEVKLLMDGVGTLHTRAGFFEPLAAAGGQFAYFLPVLHRPFRGRTNLRNHRKITIVDNHTVIAGGANIGIEYLSLEPGAQQWKDLAFTLQGPAVRHWLGVFAGDWAFAAKEALTQRQLQMSEPGQIEAEQHQSPDGIPSAQRSPETPSGDCGTDHRFALRAEAMPPETGSGVVQVVPSGPDVPNDALHDALVSMIYMAKERFWAITPYFVPNEALTEALLLAVRRGVDVRIILPRRSNHVLPDIVRGIGLRQIQEAGGRVMFYAPKMLHSKLVLMDAQVAVLGSANMDIRSLLLNYETAMFVYSTGEIAAVEAYMELIMADCACGIGPAGLARQLSESVVRLVSPLL